MICCQLNDDKLRFNTWKTITPQLVRNGKHLYNMCTMLNKRRRRWADVVQLTYTNVSCLPVGCNIVNVFAGTWSYYGDLHDHTDIRTHRMRVPISLQRQTAVTAYFSSKQSLLFVVAI